MAASAEDHAWINGQNLYFADSVASGWVDPVQLAEAIGMICNLRSFDAIGSGRQYLHRSGMVLIGDTAVITAAYLPQYGETDDFNQALIELPLSAGSGTRFSIEGKDYQCHEGLQGLFLPGQSMRALTAERTASLGFNLDPARLTALLMQMAPQALTAEQARLEWQRPRIINLQDSRVRELWQWLQSLLQMLASSPLAIAQSNGALALAIEDLLYRISLLMLCPDLIAGSSLPFSSVLPFRSDPITALSSYPVSSLTGLAAQVVSPHPTADPGR
ncbi:MAG: hypothetical protein ACKOCM_08755 [Cyanobacteriota bacterium]